MRNICLLFIMYLVQDAYAQQEYKLQVRINAVPIPGFYYSGASRIGIETIHRKYNFGLHTISFHLAEKNSEGFRQDSVFYRTRLSEERFVSGYALSILRGFPLKFNKNKLVVGTQFFIGSNRQRNTIRNDAYDSTSYRLPNGMLYRNDGGWKPVSSREENHGPKLSMVFSAFFRLELAITKHFTFSPELQFPFVVHNRIGGLTDTEQNIGFNFCLAYKFIKYKKPASPPLEI